MTGALELDLGVDVPDPERDREFEVDRTPRGLVAAALAMQLAARPCMSAASIIAREVGHGPHNEVAVAGHHVWSPDDGPLQVLDVCAGSGVWTDEMIAWCKRHGIPVEITAIELRPEEREHLERVADHVHIGDALRLLVASDFEGWHIVVGNPAFSLLSMMPGKRSLAPLLLSLARAVILLSTTQAFTRSKAAAEWLRANPPALEIRIAQGVRFRSKSGTDGISYSVTSWVPYQRHVSPGTPWPCDVLVLPAEARSWREIPGREVAR
jgi:hypothetical protein